jgi:spectinomycin phosphotransferase
LLDARREQLRRLLADYDELTREIGTGWVVTHGEPHPGNVIRTKDGPRLVDWDTVRLGPPERDLWMVIDGDTPAYAYFRLRWRLADVAEFIRDLRAPHADTEDTAAAWRFLRECLED